MVIVDANILIRAVLGKRVREILEAYSARIRFFAPDTAFAVLAELTVLIGCIEGEIYEPFETAARQRLQKRDEEGWPVLATALALESPIWTEDADFFGTGVATWTTDRVELLLWEPQEPETGEPNPE